MPYADTLFDIVNDSDQVVGTDLRSRMRADNLLHRCTAVLVLHPTTGSLLVHQRSRFKDVWPLRWDVAAGGVVEVAFHEGPFVFTDGEIEQTAWVTPLELRSRLGSDVWCLDSVRVALPFLAEYSPEWNAAIHMS